MMISKSVFSYALYAGTTMGLLATTSAQADSLRLQWDNNKHFYQRFDQASTWSLAQVKCKSMQGHLATITSDGERDFINNNLYRDRAFWIGARDTKAGSKFAWVTGERWQYQVKGSNFLLTSANDYVWASPYEWGTDSATDMNGYLCEWSSHNYLDVANVPDFNGNQVNEVAVLYIDYITQKHTVQIKDPKLNKVLSTVTFNKSGRVPSGLVVLNDINGNRLPEVGLIYSKIGANYSEFGQPTLEVKDVSNNKVYLPDLPFLNGNYTYKSVAVSPDSNGNGSNEITILGLDKRSNAPKVETRDSKTGSLISSTQF